MVEKKDVPAVPGFVTVREAAKIINVSRTRMYEFVDEGRFPLHKAGSTYLIALADLENFRPNPTGRLRKSPPKWRAYRGGGKLFATEMQVKIRSGQRERL